MPDGVDTSYTKFPTAVGKDAIDNNHYETVTPPKDQLYVGWREPGEWFNMTVDVAKGGKYRADLLMDPALPGWADFWRRPSGPGLRTPLSHVRSSVDATVVTKKQ
jgi:hypothetical protein